MPEIIEAEVVETKSVVQTYDLAILNNIAVLTSRVDEIVSSTKKKITDLKLNELKATEENKQIIRQTRADLNKEKARYNDDLKAIDAVINKELNELKKQVKEKILPLYAEQDKVLAEKLEAITAEQLKENTEYAKTYYAAKLKSMPLRIGVRYEDIPWSFNFNSSKKSIRETCDAHFTEVEKGLTIIDNHDFKNQLETLWIKHKFNIGDALTELQTQLAMADQLMKQKEAAKLAQEKREAELAEQKRLAEEKRTKEEVERKAALEVVVEPIVAVEEITDYLLKIEVTDKQLEKLIAYMMENEIDFELVE